MMYKVLVKSMLCLAAGVCAADGEVLPGVSGDDPALPGLKVPTCFGDHMVLQRGKAVPVWGWASPGAKVIVGFAGQEHRATAGVDGRWDIELTSLGGLDHRAKSG